MSRGTCSPIPTLDATSSMAQSSGSTLGTTNSKTDSLTSFTTTDLQQLSLTNSEHPIEQADWVSVNEKLRNRGLNAIVLTHPSKFQAAEGFVVLDEENAETMRKTIFHLLQENERRQTLFEELASESTKLKESKKELEREFRKGKHQRSDEQHETASHTSPHLHESESARTYRIMLEQRYEQRIEALQEEINELRHSLTMLKNETHEKKRPETSLNISSSNQLFQLPVNTDTCFKKLTPECTPRSVQTEQQQQLSDVMDMKLHKYRKKCASLKLKNGELKDENSKLHSKIHNFNENAHNTRLDGSRYEELHKQHRKLQQILKRNNLTYLLDGGHTTTSKIHEVGKLPIHDCQRYLRDICDALNVDDINDALMVARSYEKKKNYFDEIEKLLEKVSDMLLGGVPSSMRVLDDRIKLLSVVDEWKTERQELEEIYSALKDLTLLITPWKISDESPVQDEISPTHIKQLLKNVTADFYKGPTISQEDTDIYKNIVQHFMRLFDVQKYEAVYTRMHDVYVKHFELVNVFKSMREILHLRADCSLNNMVDAIGQLAKARHLLHVRQLDSVIRRIEKYDEFYEAFHRMVKELFDVLNLDSLDEIVPAVKALLQFPS